MTRAGPKIIAAPNRAWRRPWATGCLLLLALPFTSHALGPHEVAVLVNENSPRSKEVANHFIRLRDVPPQNVIYLSLPEHVLEPAAQITPDAFTEHIWEPARRTLEDRGLDHVLAWVYSVDFPVRVTTSPPMSLLGVTFTRNRIPAAEDIRKGMYRSLLFAGPDTEGGPMAFGGSLDAYREELGDRMPLPAMMLGFVGARGTDLAAILRYLNYGVLSDGTGPNGTIYFVGGNDIRAQMREWQFEGAQSELAQAGIQSDITDAMPRHQNDIMGMMMGAAAVDVPGAGAHRPGSMAEHVTSHAGEFHLPIHTKLTDWLRHGATASAGTVSEPYAIWTKFPHARFFVHYARGHTLLESFYLSIRSPTQILLVGEPLARPWRPPLSLTLVTLEEGPLSGTADFAVGLLPELPETPVRYEYYLDGRPVHRTDNIMYTLDTDAMPDGHHALRAVAYAGGPVRHQAHSTLGVTVNNHARAVRLSGVEDNADIDYYRPVTLNIDVEGAETTDVRILHNERVIARPGADAAGPVEVDPRRPGPGPVALQAAVRFPDGMEVRSSPLNLTIARLNQPPVIAPPERAAGAKGERILTPGATDPESDPISFRWYAPFRSLGEPAPSDPAARLAETEDGFHFTPEDDADFSTALFPESVRDITAIRARMTVQYERARHPANEWAGLVFNYRGDDDFYFFGLSGRPSAWTLAHRKNGRWNRLVTRGAFIQTQQPYDLAVRIGEDGRVEGLVDDRVVLEREGLTLAPENRIGWLAGKKAVLFETPFYAARKALGEHVQMDDEMNVRIPDPDRVEFDALMLEAHDGFRSSFRRIPIRGE